MLYRYYNTTSTVSQITSYILKSLESLLYGQIFGTLSRTYTDSWAICQISILNRGQLFAKTRSRFNIDFFTMQK